MWNVDFAIFFSFSLFQSFRSAASTDHIRKRWTGKKSMFSPVRISKLLTYPRANADNPAVPDRY
jgi:hypothetical protein